MKRAAATLLLSSFLFFSVSHVSGQNISGNYDKKWQKTDSIANLGQPKTALDLVNEIYLQSKKENNQGQYVKAIIYKLKLQADYRENALIRSIYELQEEIKQAKPPVRQILTSMLAELYSQYYYENSWKFDMRTTLAGDENDSIDQWDLSTISKVILRTYRKSLEGEEQLKKTPLGEFEPVLTNDNYDKRHRHNNEENPRKFRPTLFDLLAWRALGYYTESDWNRRNSSSNFIINETAQLLPGKEWLTLPDVHTDTNSTQSLALGTYRKLTAFHLADADRRALIDVEKNRLDFVYSNGIFAAKDSLYINALKKIETVYGDSPWSTDISFVLASFLDQQGNLYKPLNSELHKWQKKEAYQICEAAVKKYPGSDGAKQCKNLMNSITQKNIRMTFQENVIPEKPSLASVAFRNTPHLWFRIYKADREKDYEDLRNMNNKEKAEYFSGLTPVKSWETDIPQDGDFQEHITEVIIPALPSGFYHFVTSSSENLKEKNAAIAFDQISSNTISYISKSGDKQEILIYVLDRETGKPLKKARIESYTRNYDPQSGKYLPVKTGEFFTDENGFVSITPPSSSGTYGMFLKIISNDQVIYTDNFPSYPRYKPEQKEITTTTFFTDRAIYRPGQTIWFKGITVIRNGKDNKPAAGKEITVTLFDVNSQKVAEKTFKTNKFGSFNGSFALPAKGLRGRMSLSTSTGSTAFSVEEYKRPTFEAEFIPVTGNYRLNDSIHIKGKATAYAGNPVSGATVRYRVVRQARFPYWERWWMPVPYSAEEEIAGGFVKTGPDGSFTFTFFAIPDFSVEQRFDPVFTYSMHVDVTDINGETESAEGSVSAGYSSLIISSDIPEDFINGKDTAITVSSVNLNNIKTPVTASVKIRMLQQPDRILYDSELDTPDLLVIPENEFRKNFPNAPYGRENETEQWKPLQDVVNSIINTSTDSIIRFNDNGKKLTPGVYRLTITAKDPFDKEVKYTRNFTVSDPDAKEIPVNKPDYFVSLKNVAEPGQDAEFLVGTKEKDVSMMYEIVIGDSVLSRQWMKFDAEQRKIQIPVKEEYRGNFSVNFLFIRKNKAFTHTALVFVPFTNKKLDVKLSTFRSSMYPGEKEEWKVRITGPDGKGAPAEFLASMYDASLDVFAPNNYYFSVWNYFYGTDPWRSGNAFRYSRASGESSYPSEFVSSKTYEEINWFGLGFGGRRNRYFDKSVSASTVMEMSISGQSGEMPPPPPPTAEAKKSEQENLVPMEELPAPKEKTSIPVKTRKDFRETAFFYPSLVTDEEGSILLKFDAPEALTKWKFLGLAHTKDLKTGTVTQEVVTRKDLMVFPNAPRFVRQGDTLVFSTKIVNMSDRMLSGEVSLELSDALEGKPVDLLTGKSRTLPFTIQTGESGSVSWKITVPQDPSLSLLLYRITAVSGNFSDGEEKIIPVLTNRTLVTESLPLPVRGEGITSFNLEKLSKFQPGGTMKNYRLTLEFATNPAWYAVQALPVLEEPLHPSADNVFNAFYANNLASVIANSDPKIRTVFESWKSVTPDALLSNLEKNEDLKNALLEETPWVMEAKNESQQKQKIAQLFDLNTMDERLKNNLQQLTSLQTPEGGWSWFEGMMPSRYISQEIVTGFGRLQHLGVKFTGKENRTDEMLRKAIAYLDRELVKDYEWLKKYHEKYMNDNNLSAFAIQYLYARTYFIKDMPVDKSTREAFDYYRKQSEQYWMKEEICLQGMIALSLNRLGNKSIPSLIMKSLSEKALHSPEMGMYWAMNYGYYWYEAPVETQALLVEAYDEILSDNASVDEMNIWLLKQKQTTSWKTGRATADACYALLMRGTNILTKDQKVKFLIGDREIDPAKMKDVSQEAGTGYFRISWNGEEIKPGMGKVEVTKTGEGIAWGGLYWQYFEDLDKITSAASPLKLEKKVFLEKNTPEGPVLEPVLKGQHLKTGDRLKIRIVLSSDRDLEFVQMKDLRASAFEPVAESALSGFRYQDGLGYYQSTGDVSTSFFFDYLPKGTHVFEYPLLVNAAGDYSNGITTVQCMYAPEFGAHSEGIRVEIR